MIRPDDIDPAERMKDKIAEMQRDRSQVGMRAMMAQRYFRIGYSGYGEEKMPADAWIKVSQSTRDAFLAIADVMLDALLRPTEAMERAFIEEIESAGADDDVILALTCDLNASKADLNDEFDSDISLGFAAMIRAAKEGK